MLSLFIEDYPDNAKFFQFKSESEKKKRFHDIGEKFWMKIEELVLNCFDVPKFLKIMKTISETHYQYRISMVAYDDLRSSVVAVLSNHFDYIPNSNMIRAWNNGLSIIFTLMDDVNRQLRKTRPRDTMVQIDGGEVCSASTSQSLF